MILLHGGQSGRGRTLFAGHRMGSALMADRAKLEWLAWRVHLCIAVLEFAKMLIPIITKCTWVPRKWGDNSLNDNNGIVEGSILRWLPNLENYSLILNNKYATFKAKEKGKAIMANNAKHEWSLLKGTHVCIFGNHRSIKL